jgi:1,4-alpha-glucan branching enzyme
LTDFIGRSSVQKDRLQAQNKVTIMPKQNIAKQKVTFSYTAPSAQRVLLAGDFTGWNQAPVSLRKDKGGIWKKTVSLPPGRYEYRLLVDGEWRDDPQCSNRQPNQFGSENCVCVVNGA